MIGKASFLELHDDMGPPKMAAKTRRGSNGKNVAKKRRERTQILK